MSFRVSKHGEIIPMDTRTSISTRYKTLTKAMNREFWDSSSDTAHSLYVGSYGRGTAIDTSDIDILLELPKDEYERYDVYKGNSNPLLEVFLLRIASCSDFGSVERQLPPIFESGY